MEAMGSCCMVYSSQARICSAEKISMRKFRQFQRELCSRLAGPLPGGPVLDVVGALFVDDTTRMAMTGSRIAREGDGAGHRLMETVCGIRARQGAARAVGGIGLIL